MRTDEESYADYFSHLQKLSFVGKTYHRILKLPVIFDQAKAFGTGILEVGAGVANGMLGAYPTHVSGVDVNPHAVRFCQEKQLNCRNIKEDGSFPFEDGSFDVCVLDNVLEHIQDPHITLNECKRVTKDKGGLLIIVPGHKGYDFDKDHKLFYGESELRSLSSDWLCQKVFALPLGFKSDLLSHKLRQYCLFAVYSKR